MQDERISKQHLRASSMYDIHHGPWRARLNRRTSGGRGAWTAKHNNRKQWIQVDLGAVSKVKGVATQGRYEANQWVTSYTLAHSIDGNTFRRYRDGRSIKVNVLHCD